MTKGEKIAIIGSGISAASFCHFIDQKKFHIEVFEKARGLGGRMSYKRIDNNSFDHGANCFGAIHCKAFIEFIKPFVKNKLIQPWQGRFLLYDSKKNKIQDQENKQRLVSCPKSNSLIREMMSSIDQDQIHLQSKIAKIQQLENNKLKLNYENGDISDEFDYVIISAPAPQAAAMLPVNYKFLHLLKEINYDATFALMLEYDLDEVDIDKFNFSHIAVKHDIISRISYENSKPERNFSNCCIMIHSSNDFANQNLESDHSKITDELTQLFAKITGIKQKPKNSTIHRWLYSNPKVNHCTQTLFDENLKIGVIGDYLNRPRIEYAFESGMKMAQSFNNFS